MVELAENLKVWLSEYIFVQIISFHYNETSKFSVELEQLGILICKIQCIWFMMVSVQMCRHQ